MGGAKVVIEMAGSSHKKDDDSDDEKSVQDQDEEKEKSRVEILEKELEAVKAQLKSTQQTAREKSKEIERLKGVQEDLRGAKDAIALGLEQIKELKRDKEALLDRVQKAQNAEREAGSEARKKSAEAAAAVKEMKKVQEELEWEKKFRMGHEKAKDKLTRTVITLEAKIKQQTEFTGVAQNQLVTEQKEVQRERAQRLVEVHRLKILQDECEELRNTTRIKIAEAEVANRSAEHMQKQLDPLRQSLAEFERLAKDDAEQIEAQDARMQEVLEQVEKLESNLTRKTDEVELLTRRIEKITKAQSTLRAQVFRLLKSYPDLASYVPEIAQSSLSGKTSRSLLGPAFDVSSENLNGFLSSRSPVLSPVDPRGYESKNNSSDADPDRGDDGQGYVVKFALLLDDCLDQLQEKPKTTHQRLMIPDISQRLQQEQLFEESQRETMRTLFPPSQKSPSSKKASKIMRDKGGNFVGHGLGLRKSSIASSPSLRQQCQSIIRAKDREFENYKT